MWPDRPAHSVQCPLAQTKSTTCIAFYAEKLHLDPLCRIVLSPRPHGKEGLSPLFKQKGLCFVPCEFSCPSSQHQLSLKGKFT